MLHIEFVQPTMLYIWEEEQMLVTQKDTKTHGLASLVHATVPI